MPDISEKRFERDIEQFLVSPAGGYERFNGQLADGTWVHARKHDLDRCIYLDVLCEFIAKTQPKAWEKYVKSNGKNAPERLYKRFQDVVAAEGLLNVLRNGIDDKGIKFRLCYFKPESDLNPDAQKLYESNILGCTRQFRYSPNHANTMDMVLSVNGIPVIAIELKNQFTGQDVRCAMRQYREDRDSKEFAFRMNHRFLAYFAVDLNEAWMTTELADGDTRFLPFNQGSGGAGKTGGAGNPADPGGGYKTAYLWERVLERESLLDVIRRFVSCIEVKEKVTTKSGKEKSIKRKRMMFPRFHQYDVVNKVVADVRARGAGHNYLIEHSAGSGKSNSIAWLVYRLASLHDKNNVGVFSSVIVVTNRIVLDNQLQDTINSFDHQLGLVETIGAGKNSRSLAEAVNDGKRIIVCTIQKFVFAYRDIFSTSGRRFAIVVDEAHQGQSGESARTLRRALIDAKVSVKALADEFGGDEDDINLDDAYISALLGQGRHENQSFFAFTATPKSETLEVFGTDSDGGRKEPFHVYSMRQAIEEGYILDVLANYTTVKEAFKLVKVSKEDPELVEGAAAKALFKYYKKDGYTIRQKTEMMMANFLENGRHQIGGRGKAMVVADSRANAVRYFFAIKKYLKQHPEESEGCGVMVAFSGEVKLKEYDESFTEGSLNHDEYGHAVSTDQQFRKTFHSSHFNILVVANKYQTGFDEPLLHSMYVDKKLRDVGAVQTLSRLNRTCGGKTNTFVLDFANTEEDIRNAFLPYYEKTVMEGETDPNRVYDLRSAIAKLMIYNDEDVSKHAALMRKMSGKGQKTKELGRLTALFQPVIARFIELDETDRAGFRELVHAFASQYTYVTQLTRLFDEKLFDEYQFANNLQRILPAGQTEKVDVDDLVKLEFAKLVETFSGTITLGGKVPPVFKPPTGGTGKPATPATDTLQRIVDKVNERFGGDFTDSDKVIVKGIYDMFMHDKDVEKFRTKARVNSTQMFVKSLFPDKFQQLATECYERNRNSFEKLFTDTEFYQKVMEAMATELYKTLRTKEEN